MGYISGLISSKSVLMNFFYHGRNFANFCHNFCTQIFHFEQNNFFYTALESTCKMRPIPGLIFSKSVLMNFFYHKRNFSLYDTRKLTYVELQSNNIFYTAAESTRKMRPILGLISFKSALMNFFYNKRHFSF